MRIIRAVKNVRYESLLILWCFVLALPVLIMAFYSRPCADDYAYSFMTYKALKSGGGLPQLIKAGIDTDIFYYNNWQGLYASALIMAFTPSIFGERLYFLCTYMIIVEMFLCILLTIRCFEVVARYRLPRLRRWAFSCLVTTSMILCMPSATEGLFWYNGAVNYIPFVMLCIANVSCVLSLYYREKSKKRILLLAAATINSFVISGGNHSSSFANILMLAFICTLFIRKKKWFAAAPLASAVAGFLVMYTAPGTAVRQSCFVRSGVFDTVRTVGLHVPDLLLIWRDLDYVVIMVLCLPVLYEMTEKLGKIRLSHVFAAFALEFVVICGMQSAPYYAGAGFGAGRLVNVLWIMFLAFSLLELALATAYIRQFCYACEPHRVIRVAALILGGLILFWNPGFRGYATGRECMKELVKGQAREFADETDVRIKAYVSAAAGDSVFVKPLSERARSSVLCFAELSEDPSAYPNDTITIYYDVSVKISP